MRPTSNFAKKPKKSSKTSQSGEVRIIGGQWRGRKLKVPNKEGLRPTTDRLKETLFNWLMMDIRGAKVLDCFAGAGSLSFEAASRSAEQVVSIEKDKQAAQQLKQNAKLLGAEQVLNVQQGDFFNQVEQLSEPFDLVFIDPPFHKNMVLLTFESLISKQLVAKNGLVYLEQESNNSFDLLTSEFGPMFSLKKEKKAGQVLAQLFEFIGNC